MLKQNQKASSLPISGMRSSLQGPWRDIKSGIFCKRNACGMWDLKELWVRSLTNKPNGVLLLLFWVGSFPVFCLFLLLNKNSDESGRLALCGGNMYLHGCRLKSQSWILWQYLKLFLSNRIGVQSQEKSQQVSRERTVMENRAQILKSMRETHTSQTLSNGFLPHRHECLKTSEHHPYALRPKLNQPKAKCTEILIEFLALDLLTSSLHGLAPRKSLGSLLSTPWCEFNPMYYCPKMLSFEDYNLSEIKICLKLYSAEQDPSTPNPKFFP